MTTKRFHLGDALSITTGNLVSPSGIGGVYAILNWMTQDNLFTHQLPRAIVECRPWLLRQHPVLETITVPDFGSPDEVAPWLDEQVARVGEHLDVAPIPVDDHTHRDPLEELAEMVPPERIVVVETEG